MVKTALWLTIINITTVFQVKKHYLRCPFCFNQHQKYGKPFTNRYQQK